MEARASLLPDAEQASLCCAFLPLRTAACSSTVRRGQHPQHSKIRLVAALSSLRSSLLHLELQELLLILTNVFLLSAPPLDLEAPLADSNQLRHGPSLPAHAHAVPTSSAAGALSCLLARSHHAVVAATVAADVA